MKCPKCGINLKCPCAACQRRRPYASGLFWVRQHDIEQCPLCRFAASVYWWEDLSYQQYIQTDAYKQMRAERDGVVVLDRPSLRRSEG